MTLRLTLDALIVLDAIDRKGSFAAAAQELHKVPSAITYTIQKLEQDLDIILFDRSGHKAELTEIGKRLLYEGRYVLKVAVDLEKDIKSVAQGYELSLNIAIGDLLPIETMFPILDQFYQTQCPTRIRVLSEILGGSWDALLTDRADVTLATTLGENIEGIMTYPLGHIPFVFAIAPQHALAKHAEPIPETEILKYRVITAADSSRQLTPITASVLVGQEVLTLPDMASKIKAHCYGLGVGYLPYYMIKEELALGQLIIKQVAIPLANPLLYMAWKQKRMGRALYWFIDYIKKNQPFKDIFVISNHI